MRRTALALISFLMVALGSAPIARAERKPYVVDKAHSQLNFVGDALLISAHGYFERWEGDFQIDRANLENSKLTITVEAASLNTRVQMRDNDLRSANFFDVDKYPEIKFVSTKISKVDDKSLVVAGDLTLRATTKPVNIPVKIVFLRDADARFKGEFQINRKDFGMTYNVRMNPIEDMVNVQFDMHVSDKQVMEERQRQRRESPTQTPPKPPQK